MDGDDMNINNDSPLLSVNDFKEVVKNHREDIERHKFSRSAERFLLNNRLRAVIPKGGKYKILRRMAKLFNNKSIVENYHLAECIDPTLLNNRNLSRKSNKNDYLSKKPQYDEKIRNHFKVLNKYWKAEDHSVRFRKDKSKLMHLSPTDKSEPNTTPKMS